MARFFFHQGIYLNGCISQRTQLILLLLSGFLVILRARNLLDFGSWAAATVPEGTTTEVKKGIDMCKASTRKPKLFTNVYPQNSDLSSLLEGPGMENLQTNNYTACKFRYDDHSSHFPHAMQQLYRCVSLWRSDPTKESWLVMQKATQHTYISGFLDAIKAIWGVKIVRFRQASRCVEYSRQEGSRLSCVCATWVVTLIFGFAFFFILELERCWNIFKETTWHFNRRLNCASSTNAASMDPFPASWGRAWYFLVSGNIAPV